MTTTDRSARGNAVRAGRLRRPREFRAVYGRGLRRVSRSFVVFVLPNDRHAARLGLTTPRKLGKAHERNRIRRRIRAMFRGLRFPPGADIVINPRRAVLEGNFEELRRELVSLLEAGG